jgi:cell division protein FtsB
MATRSGSGTGVVVSLVVFVLCTVFLLVLSIVFYSGQTKASERQLEAQTTLAKYVTRDQRNRDQIKQLEARANPNRGDSVVKFLRADYETLMEYVTGNSQGSIDSLRSNFRQQFGVADDSSVRSVLQQQRRKMNAQQTENDGLQAQVAAATEEIENLDSSIERMRQDHQDELAAVIGKIDEYEQAAIDYREEVRAVKGEYFSSIERLKDQYEGEIARLENEKDDLFQQSVLLKDRVGLLQETLGANRPTGEDPSQMVDGMIVDSIGRDEVFINRGRRDRIVLGMTFEVYDNAAALTELNRMTGELPRGKASLQVTQVRDTTSKGKITRSVPGRPVVRNDVIANAVYDPDYVFKFLIHGKFDVDGDGRPTPTEANFLRSLIIDWGGEVISGEKIPGDLDFLVLGVEPPRPLPPRPDATEYELDAWVQKRRAHELYLELFKQASDAQIPVLNSNRFFILIGYTDR